MTAPLPPPPPPAAQPIVAATIVPRNGYGITALVLALIGLVLGLVPLTGFLALILGALAVLFGLLGWARANRGEATNRRMTAIGTVLGVLAAALGIWGMTIVFSTVDDLDKAFNGQGGIGTGVELPGQPESDEAVNQLPFGQSFTYEDGTVVAVDPPVPYQASSTAFIADGAARWVALKVTVTNGATKPLELIGVSIQATAGEQAVEQVFDSTKGMHGPPSQTLPPGQRQTFTVAFGLPSGERTDFRVQINPSMFGYQPVFYTGQV